MKKLIAGALISGAAIVGLGVGSGHANASIEPGKYKLDQSLYGVIPTPQSNARVVGNTLQQDFYGIGPQNLLVQSVIPTKKGGNASFYGNSPAGQWVQHTEFRKVGDKYVGTTYAYGQIPVGNTTLTKVKPHVAHR